MAVNVNRVRRTLSTIYSPSKRSSFHLVDCIKPDDTDPGICLSENRSLCGISEIFTFKCLHLCGKC